MPHTIKEADSKHIHARYHFMLSCNTWTQCVNPAILFVFRICYLSGHRDQKHSDNGLQSKENFGPYYR